jgi:hypothetical protein
VSSTSNDAGTFSINIAGSITNAHGTFSVTQPTSFTLTVLLSLCLQETTIITDTSLPNIEYTVGTQ